MRTLTLLLIPAVAACVADTTGLDPGAEPESAISQSAVCAGAPSPEFLTPPLRARSLFRISRGLVFIDEDGGGLLADRRLGTGRSGTVVLLDPATREVVPLVVGLPTDRLLDLWPGPDSVIILTSRIVGDGVGASVFLLPLGGVPRPLTQVDRLGVTTLFGVDDRFVYLHELPDSIGGDSHLYRVPLEGGTLQRITSIHGIRAPQISGDTIFFLAPTTPKDFGTMRAFTVPASARDAVAEPLGDVRCTGWLRVTDRELYCTERTGAPDSSPRQVSVFDRAGTQGKVFFDLTVDQQRDGPYLGPVDSEELYLPTNGARINERYPFRVLDRGTGKVRFLTCDLGKIGFRQHGAEPDLTWDEGFVYWVDTRLVGDLDTVRIARAARGTPR